MTEVHRRATRAAALIWALMLCAIAMLACSSLGVPPADTFSKRVAVGYVTAATVSQSAALLYDAGKLDREQARKIHDEVGSAIGALNAAEMLARTDIAAAESRLAVTIAALTAMQSYLQATQGAKP